MSLSNISRAGLTPNNSSTQTGQNPEVPSNPSSNSPRVFNSLSLDRGYCFDGPTLFSRCSNDVLNLFFNYCNLKDLLAVRLVSKDYCVIANFPLWHLLRQKYNFSELYLPTPDQSTYLNQEENLRIVLKLKLVKENKKVVYEVNKLNELISSGLTPDQQWILSKVEKIDLSSFSVDAWNNNGIQMLLDVIKQGEVFPSLTSLVLGSMILGSQLIISEISCLKKILVGTISGLLNVKSMLCLEDLQLGLVYKKTTLEDLPRLNTFYFTGNVSLYPVPSIEEIRKRPSPESVSRAL